jgi:hypothetical protein
MSGNSASCKTWCLTLVSATLVVVADKAKPDYAFVALAPAVLFTALDSYYLALEKGFRQAYSEFVRRLHVGEATPEDLYDVAPAGNWCVHVLAAVGSFSVWGFYGALAGIVVLIRVAVLK